MNAHIREYNVRSLSGTQGRAPWSPGANSHTGRGRALRGRARESFNAARPVFIGVYVTAKLQAQRPCRDIGTVFASRENEHERERS